MVKGWGIAMMSSVQEALVIQAMKEDHMTKLQRRHTMYIIMAKTRQVMIDKEIELDSFTSVALDLHMHNYIRQIKFHFTFIMYSLECC